MVQTQEKLQKEDILKLFTCKPKLNHTVGLEYERLPISNKTFEAVDYNAGICDFLRDFAREEQTLEDLRNLVNDIETAKENMSIYCELMKELFLSGSGKN